MNTTNLFVELVVIGVGTLLALMLTIMSIFGYGWISWEKVTSSTMLIPLLSITYLLGIVIDRLADSFFDNWNKKLRLKIFTTNEEYHQALTYVYNYASERIVSLFLYGRSRLRISRAWSFNCIFLAITISIFVWTRLSQISYSDKIIITVFSTIIFGLGTVANCFTWRKLTINDYKRLAETNTILRNNP
jgi:hypothetical protein